ncbi:MAG: helix-turn-helix domain-containing protein [Bacteroidales bacterium]|nr:helix-turn-helix domain-containing protein [Bacteroidales bacterium]
MTTGQLIKELRLKKGITQEELAEKTELSVRTIQRIENGEVDPRSFTLQAIASALDVDFGVLNNSTEFENKAQKESKTWLPLLHISGLFILLFPPIIIWIWKKDKIKNIREHAIDVVNFQLSMLIFIIPASFLVIILIGLPIVIFLGMFSTVVIIINTAKVVNNQPYKYPWSIKILKKHP